MSERGLVEQQIAKIREMVAAEGGATVGCEELKVLCPDYLTISEQFARIASIAQKEKWSFAFLAGGSVRFGSYDSAK